MTKDKLAGVVIILGVILWFVAMFVAPRLYQEPDIAERATIIEQNKVRWVISQVLFGLGMAMPTFGFLLFTVHVHNLRIISWNYFAATSFTTGSLLGITFIYLQTFDPIKYWQSSQPPILIIGGTVLILLGIFFYGIVIVQVEFPQSLGYLAIGSAILLLAVFILTRATSGFVIVSLMYIVAFVIAIRLLTTTPAV